MKKRNVKLVLAVVLSGFLLAACGSSQKDAGMAVTTESNMAMDQAYEDSYKETGEIYEYDTGDSLMDEAVDDSFSEESSSLPADKAENVASNRKLIKRVSMNVETQEFDQMIQSVENRVAFLGGYMEQSSVEGNSYSKNANRYADFTARIPANKLDEFVVAVGAISNVTNKTETATDVTLDYVDTKSRKEALEVEQERMMQLLEKAEDLETIIGLEQRLTNIRYELQNYESQIRTYDNLVDYATVSIHVTEVKVYTPVETPEKTDWERMTEGFVASLYDIGNGIKNFAIGFVICLPYLFVWAVVIAVFILVVRGAIKGSAKRRQKKIEKKEEKEQKQKEAWKEKKEDDIKEEKKEETDAK